MCGIVGYVGYRSAQDVLIEGLHRLEYRGYDSAGIAVADDGQIAIRKTAGRVRQLAASLEADPFPAPSASGTRAGPRTAARPTSIRIRTSGATAKSCSCTTA